MSRLTFSEIVTHMMRPPGGGIQIVSAGKGAAFELQQRHFEILTRKKATTPDEINEAWAQSIEAPSLARAKVAVIGVPLDTGAGIRRGAMYGPRAVREKLLQRKDYPNLIASGRVVDLGDVYVNPHLLHDEMLAPGFIAECRKQMYPQAVDSLRDELAVSALSQVKQILTALKAEHPKLKIFVLGGDHSIGWPVTEALNASYPGTLGIVQPDAHTDLLSTRYGIKYCFGTWSYHAHELIGGGGRLVQLGIRQSGRDKAHWESTVGVKQYWAEEVRRRPHDEVIAEMIAHLKARGVKHIYFSNDIDGTDESEASATGTPAADGLSSEFVLKVIAALGRSFEMVGADIMEVAPDLAKSDAERNATAELAARYTAACLEEQIR